jgi:hypothetical protein
MIESEPRAYGAAWKVTVVNYVPNAMAATYYAHVRCAQ